MPRHRRAPTILDAIRGCAGEHDLSESFLRAVAGSAETAQKVTDSLAAWADGPATVPSLHTAQLRPFIDTRWARAGPGSGRPGEELSPLGTQLRFPGQSAAPMLKRLLLYCHSVLVPVFRQLADRSLIWDVPAGRQMLAGTVTAYATLAPLIDRDVVIFVPELDWAATDREEYEGAVALAWLAHSRQDPLGPIPPEVAALLGDSAFERKFYRDHRRHMACRSIIHSQLMLKSVGQRGCLMFPSRRWEGLFRLASRRLSVDENLVLVRLLEAPLPLLDDQTLPLADIRALRESDAFEQWRQILAQALEPYADPAQMDWTSASAQIREATLQLRRNLKRSSVKERLRTASTHFGILGASSAAQAPVHLLDPHAAAIEGGLVTAYEAVDWFRGARRNKRLEGTLACHAAVFDAPARTL